VTHVGDRFGYVDPRSGIPRARARARAREREKGRGRGISFDAGPKIALRNGNVIRDEHDGSYAVLHGESQSRFFFPSRWK